MALSSMDLAVAAREAEGESGIGRGAGAADGMGPSADGAEGCIGGAEPGSEARSVDELLGSGGGGGADGLWLGANPGGGGGATEARNAGGVGGKPGAGALGSGAK